RKYREGQPDSDFTLVYHLFSFERIQYLRIKVALKGEYPSMPSITLLWKNANWYEREVFDMFGIKFDGHPHMTRLMMPKSWVGHPLRKEHPSRATEMGQYNLTDELQDAELNALTFVPEDWGMKRANGDTEFMFLNIGPQHPGTHGVLRIIAQLDGEEIEDLVPEIGYHHRGAEKMAERQTWHSFIPYTDRIDYLGGVLNNLAYLLPVEKLAGIIVPDRAQVIRVMLSEFFRISSHLVWYGTYAQDLGQLSPVFYMFADRERVLEIVEAITGARMHPSWFRIGGTAMDLPKGWEKLVKDFIDYFPKRLNEYNNLVMKNSLIKARTRGIGIFTTEEAIEWGATGSNLRATGFEFDFRKATPYSGYDQFEFEIPVGANGDCYDRGLVRVEEMRQSLRIIEQCLKNMPSGPYKADHPLTTPPPKVQTMQDIETLINHFVGVTWGPVVPAGEAMIPVEASKGNNSYYLISDAHTNIYRNSIRTPSFAHMQMLPLITRGYSVADLLATLGAMDFVLADIDK
ncbi:MAG: NADH-quinone oxidoreductase subunit C/D, partial [Bacteroidales bacterium]|nr:NADH-quinone oxidoreductase subunit C/D [Bacteroidales bacterium]